MTKSILRGVWCTAGVAVALGLCTPTQAEAQITRVSNSASEHRHAVGVTLGGFFLKGEDSRVEDDVLYNDLDSLLFDIKDFNGPTVSGEWLVGVSDYLEAGVSAGYYQKSVPSIYAELTHPSGSEIEQELKLRIVPLTATLRFLPIGRGSVEPYVGAGIGAFRWRYSETGEFVDFADKSIFRNRYIADGTAYGPVVLGGIRFPFGEAFSFGGELRYQWAEGDTNPSQSELLGSKLDLGGLNAAVTLHVRF